MPVLIVFVAAAAVAVAVLPKQYEASASLFVGQDRPISASSSAQLDDVLAKSYAALLASPLVADRALARVGGGLSRSQLLSRMTFQVTPGTQLIVVTAVAGSPERAAQLANGYAETFVAQQQASDAQSQKSRLGRLARQIGVVSVLVEKLRFRGPRSKPELGVALGQLSSLRSTYQALQQNLALQGSNLTFSTRAAPAVSPSAPKPVPYLLAALVLGLLLAIGAALLRDRLDRRIWDEDEMLLVAGAPILARIPKSGRGGDSSLAEAFDFLRTNLMSPGKPSTILVTSPSAGDGKTAVVSGLSRSIANVGQSVIAADCDFRAHKLSESYRGHATAGLEDVGTGASEPLATLVTANPSNFRVAVARGQGGKGSTAWLDRRSGQRIIDSLVEHAEFVVIDTAPVMAAPETSVLAAGKVDAVILVVDLKATKRDALVAAIEQLERSGAYLRGVVVNRVGRTTGYGYG